jgi:hypothetical protein
MTNPRDYALPDPSLDPEAQRIAWERDRNERAARHMMGSAIKAAREEAHKEGRRAGKAESLVRNLTNKFGPLAAEHPNRVEGADEATVDRWSDAMFKAASIDDLFRL